MNSWKTSWWRNSNAGARGAMCVRHHSIMPLCGSMPRYRRGTWPLPQELPREPAAAAAEVEDERERLRGQRAKRAERGRIVEDLGLRRADQTAELHRRQRQVDHRVVRLESRRVRASGRLADRLTIRRWPCARVKEWATLAGLRLDASFMLNACTIIACNYLPFATVLADSFFDAPSRRTVHGPPRRRRARRVHAGSTIVSTWLRLGDIGLDRAEIDRLAGIYDVTELVDRGQASAPPVSARQRGAAKLIYLDPDIRIYGSLQTVADAGGRDTASCSRRTRCGPSRETSGRSTASSCSPSGVYNLGFIGGRRVARARSSTGGGRRRGGRR